MKNAPAPEPPKPATPSVGPANGPDLASDSKSTGVPKEAIGNNSDVSTPMPPSPANPISYEKGQEASASSRSGFIGINKKIIIISGMVLLLLVAFGFAGYYLYGKIGDEDSLGGDKKGNPVRILGGNNSSCEASYNKLLEANNFDFDTHCKESSIRTGNFKEEEVQEKTNKMVLVFDASGSMAAQINGKRKIDIAKDAAKGFIDKVANDKNFSLSIVVYGHKGSNSASQKGVSCAGIEEIYYMGEVNSQVAKSKLDSFNATGWTPIASSLKKASEILTKNPGDKNFVLLVSDGEETCGGDPVSTARSLSSNNLKITANVVGFDVGGKDEEQLRAIAEAGGGDYFSAKDEQDLETAFEKHKQMLNTADFKIGRTIEQLYDMSFIINNYNQCYVMLKKEESAMMLDIHASKLAGEKCEEYADKKYRERFNEIKNSIEDSYEKSKESFDQLKS